MSQKLCSFDETGTVSLTEAGAAAVDKTPVMWLETTINPFYNPKVFPGTQLINKQQLVCCKVSVAGGAQTHDRYDSMQSSTLYSKLRTPI